MYRRILHHMIWRTVPLVLLTILQVKQLHTCYSSTVYTEKKRGVIYLRYNYFLISPFPEPHVHPTTTWDTVNPHTASSIKSQPDKLWGGQNIPYPWYNTTEYVFVSTTLLYSPSLWNPPNIFLNFCYSLPYKLQWMIYWACIKSEMLKKTIVYSAHQNVWHVMVAAKKKKVWGTLPPL